jgi:ubiquinone/menaquinone biosynthesis C-methylase UbiE
MSKMTWEETITFIRTQPEYKELVELAYFEADLSLNVERFRKSEEYAETRRLIEQYASLSSSARMLDIGSGNGISAAAFALDGIWVDAVEPDPSQTIGAGAIRKLKEQYNLPGLSIYEGFAEDLGFPDNVYDIVYTRQCMHHAHDLPQFLKESARVLKPGGLLITIRDHVIYNETDKKWFLENHPLQKFYGGENAFTFEEYSSAIVAAGFEIKQVLKHFDTPINYFPLKRAEKELHEKQNENYINSAVKKKLGYFAQIPFLNKLAKSYVKKRTGDIYREERVPGRMYSFIAIKK